ncbi:hypothetical protein [Deinococcus maricopensis]|uniref:Flagellar hook-associated protein FlgK n=1 Tax=Deinococcus maricopensis (strain DSM 21211 / LMG 22137 / NRRL B-23946 / LB-34) TaxID=709986 RepID=E8UBD2_DEIML|nr:hypothetical protein [Deinococcus maricopensis]ADV68371.1 flagellar hook-associated protein FlgK [Deinococcus maricopensis DSM 21211]
MKDLTGIKGTWTLDGQTMTGAAHPTPDADDLSSGRVQDPCERLQRDTSFTAHAIFESEDGERWEGGTRIDADGTGWFSVQHLPKVK